MSLISPRSLRRHAIAPRISAVLALSVLAAALAMPTAQAGSLLQAAKAQHRHIERALHRVEAHQELHADRLSRKVARIGHDLSRAPSARMFGGSRWLFMRHHLQDAITRLRGNLDRHQRRTLARLRSLRAQRDAITQWLDEWGTFQTCPVAGPNQVMNNFGVIVDLPEVPVHIHMGNDIMASAGTPIVAPFDGDASASASVLGGMEVRVSGADGYAYNAHLSAYGKLGPVKTGDVIGYVGTTGDATGPHDHFEWHPGNGVAVDPNPLLSVVC
jgi:murein DD-endopeptidase MepM/ murein hydrolase activator NlpD